MKAKILVPFPYIDLHLFVPSWADEVRVLCFSCLHVVLQTCCLQLGLDGDDVDMDPEAASAAKPNKKKLDLVKWIAAYQCFALASDAAEVCSSLFFCILLRLMFRAFAGLEIHGSHGTLSGLHGSGGRGCG